MTDKQRINFFKNNKLGEICFKACRQKLGGSCLNLQSWHLFLPFHFTNKSSLKNFRQKKMLKKLEKKIKSGSAVFFIPASKKGVEKNTQLAPHIHGQLNNDESHFNYFTDAYKNKEISNYIYKQKVI